MPSNEQALDNLNPTTRRYPRTLAEAFPDSIERAEWWFPPEPYRLSAVELLTLTAAVSGWIALAYIFAKD